MILYRNGLGLFDQEEIAWALGVRVAQADVQAFHRTMPLMTSFNNDEGVSTMELLPQIEAFLRSRQIRMFRPEVVPYTGLSGALENVIMRALAADTDIWMEYHCQEMHKEDPPCIHVHDGLIESYFSETGVVNMTDSLARRQQRFSTDLVTLDRSISPLFGRPTGMILMHKR